MAKYGIGLKDLKIGAQAANGGMGTSLVSVGKVYKETASIIDEDGTVTKHFAENDRYPFLTVYEAAGTTIKFTLTDIAPDKLKEFFGGEVEDAAKAWKSPMASFSCERSLSLETVMGLTVDVPNAFIYAKLNWNLGQKEIAKVEVTAEVQAPKVASESPMIIRETALA